MNRWVLVLAIAFPGLCGAQDNVQLPPPPPPNFWPTPQMMEQIVDNFTQNLGSWYQMDAGQMEQTRPLIKHFRTWFERNRAEIQDLSNQYIAAVNNGEPPTPEVVAQWAQRVQPLTQDFRRQMDTTIKQMRGFMRPEQLDRLEQDMAAVNVGYGFMSEKLNNWGAGKFDPAQDWIKSPQFLTTLMRVKQDSENARETTRVAQQQARGGQGGNPGGGGAGGGGAQPAPAPTGSKPGGAAAAKPKDPWETYVDSVVQKYKLDDTQKEQAFRILRQMQQDRDQYLARHSSDLERISKMVESAKTAEEKTKANAELAKISEPVDQRFSQLKERIERIPTAKQRRESGEKPGESHTEKK